MEKKLSLYIHIPFRLRKCNYCDFLSFGGCDFRQMEKYSKALVREIESYKGLFDDTIVDTIFFGGGTPSILELPLLEEIFYAIKRVFIVSENAEITLEMNPGTTDEKKLIGYRQLGINRISIGLQSANKKELELLGRIHTYEKFVATMHDARAAGFDNINIDMMSGLPGQTLSDFRVTLSKVIALKPEHISCYDLIIEEGTPFYDDEKVLDSLPDEETTHNMYNFTKTMLAGYGYKRYEISNYAKPGYESRHNLTYWTDGRYLGLGLGASSYIDDLRFKNNSELKRYEELTYEKNNGMTKSWHEEITVVSEKDHMEEYIFLGLRTMKGISVKNYHETFGKDIFEIYGEVIRKHIDEKMLVLEDDRLHLTDAGIWVSNYVMSDFII